MLIEYRLGRAPDDLDEIGVSHSKRFGLDEREARSVIEEVIAVVRQWREVYAACGVSPADREAIAAAFLPEGFFYEAPKGGSPMGYDPAGPGAAC
jgi:hypothetical protein